MNVMTQHYDCMFIYSSTKSKTSLILADTFTNKTAVHSPIRAILNKNPNQVTNDVSPNEQQVNE